MNIQTLVDMFDLEITQTGGGCTAYAASFDQDQYVLLTSTADAIAPDLTDTEVLIGGYGADDSMLFVPMFATVEEAQEIIQRVSNWQDASC